MKRPEENEIHDDKTRSDSPFAAGRCDLVDNLAATTQSWWKESSNGERERKRKEERRERRREIRTKVSERERKRGDEEGMGFELGV